MVVIVINIYGSECDFNCNCNICTWRAYNQHLIAIWSNDVICSWHFEWTRVCVQWFGDWFDMQAISDEGRLDVSSLWYICKVCTLYVVIACMLIQMWAGWMPLGAISLFQVFRVLSLGINKSNQIMTSNTVQLHIVSLFATVISATAVKIKNKRNEQDDFI